MHLTRCPQWTYRPGAMCCNEVEDCLTTFQMWIDIQHDVVLPLEMPVNDLHEEEIENGLQLTLFFLRHLPYLDGGGMGTITAAPMTVGLLLKSRGMAAELIGSVASISHARIPTDIQ